MNTLITMNRCKISRIAIAAVTLFAAASVGFERDASAQDVPAASQMQSDAPAAAQSAPNASPGANSTSADAGASEERLALVIGNSSYRDAPLANPANDARAMAATLKTLGFKVMERENASLEDMRKLVREFGDRLALGAVGLFYYAGHGVQSGDSSGEANYLIPVDADIQDETELATRAFNAKEVISKMVAAKNRVNIVILDACRNNPLVRKMRSATVGLARMDEGNGMIIEFATAPGRTAIDGEGAHGLYTGELLNALQEPGLSVEEVFKKVRSEVSRKSGQEQVPWENTSLVDEFYFIPTPGQTRLAVLPPVMRAEQTGAGAARTRDISRVVLVPRLLVENYQLTANFPLSAPLAVGEFTPDARRYVMVTQDRQLKALDAATGNVSFSHAGFDAANLTADGRYVVGISDDRLINVLDVAADEFAVKTYHAVRDVQSAFITPNGQRMLVISRAGVASVLKLESDTVVGAPIKIDGDPIVQFSPSGNRAAVWTAKNGDLLLIDMDSGKRAGRSSSHRKPINLVRFSQDGSLVMTAAEDDAVFVWRAADGSKVARLDLGDKSPLPSHAEFIDDGKHLLIHAAETNKQTGIHQRLGVWDVSSGKSLSTLIADSPITDLQFSLDRQQIYVTTPDHAIRIFDMNTKAVRTTLSGAEFIGFSTDGTRLLTREGVGVRLYDARTLTPVARMPDQVTAFVGPKTNGLFATAGNDGSLRLYDFEHGDLVSQLKGHVDTISHVNFADGGKRLVSFSRERIAKFWGLPDVEGADKLRRDTYESTSEYEKRLSEWSSPFTTLVELGDYNPDAETYAVKVGVYSFQVPVPRTDARRFAGQREAVLSGRLKFFDTDQLQLGEGKLERLP